MLRVFPISPCVLVLGLKPGTEYIIRITALQNGQSSVALVGKATTRKCTKYSRSYTLTKTVRKIPSITPGVVRQRFVSFLSLEEKIFLLESKAFNQTAPAVALPLTRFLMML